MELDFAYIGTSNTSYTWIPLCGAGSPAMSFWMHKTQLKATIEWGSYDPELSAGFPAIVAGTRHVIKSSNKTFYFDGESITSTTVNVGTVGAPIHIFANGDSGGSGVNNRNVSMKVFEFKLYQAGVLQKDFIPAKRNSEDKIGMLETQTNTFYPNAGSGNFTAGNL